MLIKQAENEATVASDVLIVWLHSTSTLPLYTETNSI